MQCTLYVIRSDYIDISKCADFVGNRKSMKSIIDFMDVELSEPSYYEMVNNIQTYGCHVMSKGLVTKYSLIETVYY